MTFKPELPPCLRWVKTDPNLGGGRWRVWQISDLAATEGEIIPK